MSYPIWSKSSAEQDAERFSGWPDIPNPDGDMTDWMIEDHRTLDEEAADMGEDRMIRGWGE